MAGNISLQEFQRCITQLLTISDQLADGWTLHNKESPEAMYLVKKITFPDTENKSYENATALPLEEPLDSVLEDMSTVATPRRETYTWEYHVLFNQSYSVPTLYFNAWTSHGRLLSLEEMWSRVHVNFQHSIQEDKWSVLTQQEHPVLRRPFYMFHPCRTPEFLKCFEGKSSNIVITWLSTVGPAVGLTLAPKYGQSISVE
jgi:ubiquitin-like-conjugating enzyme ATG10